MARPSPSTCWSSAAPPGSAERSRGTGSAGVTGSPAWRGAVRARCPRAPPGSGRPDRAGGVRRRGVTGPGTRSWTSAGSPTWSAPRWPPWGAGSALGLRLVRVGLPRRRHARRRRVGARAPGPPGVRPGGRRAVRPGEGGLRASVPRRARCRPGAGGSGRADRAGTATAATASGTGRPVSRAPQRARRCWSRRWTRPVQVIDVDDLAGWLVECAEARRTGVVNTNGDTVSPRRGPRR